MKNKIIASAALTVLMLGISSLPAFAQGAGIGTNSAAVSPNTGFNYFNSPVNNPATNPAGYNTGNVNFNSNSGNNFNQGNNNNNNNNSKRFEVSQGTYIIQDGDSLWLVMGNLKAKLSVLVYQEPEKNERNSNYHNNHNNNNSNNNNSTYGQSRMERMGFGEDKNALDLNFNQAIPFVIIGQ